MKPLLQALAEATGQAEKNLLVASCVCQLFREKGWETVVVGGSALELYTEGGYVTADVDLCRAVGTRPIPATVEAEVMRAAGATSLGVRRQWSLGGVVIDLLGEAETVGKAPFRTLQGPYGDLRVMPAEEVLVERAFMAYAQGADCPNFEALAAAKQIILAGLAGTVAMDWEAVDAIAEGPEYDNKARVDELKKSVEQTLRPPREETR